MAAGLAREELQRGVKVFMPEPVERLRTLYRNKIRDLRIKEKNLDSVIPELENRTGVNLLRPRLTPFEGKKDFRAALEDILTSKSGSITTCLWPMRAVMDMVSPEFMRFHTRERIRRGINVRGIWPRSQGVDISAYPYLAWGPELKSELRYAPLGTDLVLGYWVYGHKTLFLSQQQSGINGYTLESADMDEMMKVQHAAMWKNSEPVPFDKSAANGFISEISNAA